MWDTAAAALRRRELDGGELVRLVGRAQVEVAAGVSIEGLALEGTWSCVVADRSEVVEHVGDLAIEVRGV